LSFYTIERLRENFQEPLLIARLVEQGYNGVWVCSACSQWYSTQEKAEACERVDRERERFDEIDGEILPRKLPTSVRLFLL
jgi:hypothetical protein